jgi:hypothetical protein
MPDIKKDMEMTQWEQFIAVELRGVRSQVTSLERNMNDRFDRQKNTCIGITNGCSQKFTHNRMFFWIIGFLIVGMIGIGSYGAATRMDLTAVETKVETIHK